MTSLQTTTLPTLTEAQREHWGRAIALWLASRRSPSTRRAYAAALQDLQASVGSVWEIGRADVVAWCGELRKRGLSDATIALRLAGVSSFYRFCLDDYTIVQEDGRERGLALFNPAGSATLRPRITPYGKSTWLRPEEARALLAVIDRSKPQGLRDFALFLGYLMTGRRNSEWRRARIEHFISGPSGVSYAWHGKGKVDQRQAISPPVWAALQAWSAARGPRAGSCLFHDISGDGTRELCPRQVGALLKRYARLAGLDAGRIHVHTLRHSAAMLRKEAGMQLDDISGFLSHSSLAVTQIYLHTLEGREDSAWGTVAQMLGL